MWSESFVEGYIRNIGLLRKHNVTAYSICHSQSYSKISIRSRINFISLHGCRSKSYFFLDMRLNFCSFNCTVALKKSCGKKLKITDGLRPPSPRYGLLLLLVYCIICKLFTDKAIYFFMDAYSLGIFVHAKKVHIRINAYSKYQSVHFLCIYLNVTMIQRFV